MSTNDPRRRLLAALLAAFPVAAVLVLTPAGTGAAGAATGLTRFSSAYEAMNGIPPGSWTPGGMALYGLPAGAVKDIAVSHDGSHVAVVGSDGYLYVKEGANSEDFVPIRTNAGGLQSAKKVAIDTDLNGLVQLAVVVGTDGRLSYRTKPASGAWSQWVEPAAIGQTYTDVSLSIDGYGNAHVVAIGAKDNLALYRIRRANGNWDSWISVSGLDKKTVGSVAIAAVTSTSLPPQTTSCPGAAPVTWRRTGATLISAVTFSDPIGNAYLVGRELDGRFGPLRYSTTGQPTPTWINNGLQTDLALNGLAGRVGYTTTEGKLVSVTFDDLFVRVFGAGCPGDFTSPWPGSDVPLVVGSGGFAMQATMSGFGYHTQS